MTAPRMHVFHRYGKTAADATQGIRREYRVHQVRPTGKTSSGLKEYRIIVSDRSAPAPSKSQVLRRA